MKKFLSLFLAALMLLSLFAFPAAAEEYDYKIVVQRHALDKDDSFATKPGAILAEQNIAEIITVPDAVKGADFALTCKGDSMINARIFDGDIVYIHLQDTVENGEIAAVLIGDEATLKRVYHTPGRLTLRPCNPMYPDFEFSGEDLNKIRILGKAIAFTSMVR